MGKERASLLSPPSVGGDKPCYGAGASLGEKSVWSPAPPCPAEDGGCSSAANLPFQLLPHTVSPLLAYFPAFFWSGLQMQELSSGLALSLLHSGFK